MQTYINYLCQQIGHNFIINRFSYINNGLILRRINLINKAHQPACGLCFFTPIVNKSNFYF